MRVLFFIAKAVRTEEAHQGQPSKHETVGHDDNCLPQIQCACSTKVPRLAYLMQTKITRAPQRGRWLHMAMVEKMAIFDTALQDIHQHVQHRSLGETAVRIPKCLRQILHDIIQVQLSCCTRHDTFSYSNVVDFDPQVFHSETYRHGQYSSMMESISNTLLLHHFMPSRSCAVKKRAFEARHQSRL